MASAATLAMQDRGPEVLAVVVAITCVSTVFIVLRLISRIGIVRRVSNDDYAIIVAWVSDFQILEALHQMRLIGGSSLRLASPSPSATGQASGWVVMKPMSNRNTT